MYTTDGDDVKKLNRGKIPNVYATVDFGLGKDASKSFGHQRQVEPHGMKKLYGVLNYVLEYTSYVKITIIVFIKQTNIFLFRSTS